jgi:hypothetical protein
VKVAADAENRPSEAEVAELDEDATAAAIEEHHQKQEGMKQEIANLKAKI